MDLGTATAAAGTVETGFLDVAELPTGGTERLPVIVAEGAHEGPQLWITATIHGDEANGIAVAQDVLDAIRPETLRGTVICFPNLNPAGLRRNERTSYYGGDDPNRCFPEPGAGEEPPGVQELINRQVYDALADSADAVLDLHTASIGAFPFTIRHRVLHGDRRSEPAARRLATDLDELVTAFGFPIANQRDAYTEEDYHRTTTGAALNYAGIPATTVELGGHSVVDDELVSAGVAGCFRVMVALDMLDAVPTAIDEADPGYDAPVEYPVKRADGPRTDTPGVVRHRIGVGEAFEADDPIADIVTPHGRRKTTVAADRDGYVIDRREGVAAYENDPVAGVVVRDDGDVVVPGPDDW